MTMTREQARGAHDITQGTIGRGTAVCRCGLWAGRHDRTADWNRMSRKAHLDEVLRVRLVSTT